MSEIQGKLNEVDSSLKKIENLSVKIKKHYFRRQNTKEQIETITKFIYLEDFITSRLTELSHTQTDIQILSQLNAQIDELQIKVDKFESHLNDEYWNRYQDVHTNTLPKDYLDVHRDLEVKSTSKSCPDPELLTLSTNDSVKFDLLNNDSCKCAVF